MVLGDLIAALTPRILSSKVKTCLAIETPSYDLKRRIAGLFPTNPPGEGFVPKIKFSRNASIVAEFVVGPDKEPPEFTAYCDAQGRVLEKMGWTKENYFEIVRLLIVRKDIRVEDLDPAEKRVYFEIYDGLSAAFKRMIPPSEFGFLGGRARKIPPEKHEQVRNEVRELLSAKLSASQAYAIVGKNWNQASPATIKRICQDRRP